MLGEWRRVRILLALSLPPVYHNVGAGLTLFARSGLALPPAYPSSVCICARRCQCECAFEFALQSTCTSTCLYIHPPGTSSTTGPSLGSKLKETNRPDGYDSGVASRGVGPTMRNACALSHHSTILSITGCFSGRSASDGLGVEIGVGPLPLHAPVPYEDARHRPGWSVRGNEGGKCPT